MAEGDFPRDDNLRLIIAADHEDFLVDEIRQYRTATRVLIVLWLVMDAALALRAGSEASAFSAIIDAALLFGIFGFPFGVVFLIRNGVRVRKVAAQYDNHVAFLRGYDRAARKDPAEVHQLAESVVSLSYAGAAVVTTASLGALGYRLLA